MDAYEGILDRALELYFRDYSEQGIENSSQPSSALSDFDDDGIFVLRNINGDLARYEVADSNNDEFGYTIAGVE